MHEHSKDGWWHQFYINFQPFFAKYGAKKTNAEARYYLKKLNLKKGSTFLDCPCGVGRISIPLAKKGIKVTGVDITQPYLHEVAVKAKKHNLAIERIESDMRKIDFKNKFDAAANLWTSFGYFEKESDNKLVLKKFFQALKPGGKFLLQVINRDWIMRNFLSRSWDRVNDMKIIEERSFNYQTSQMYDNWTFLRNGKETLVKSTIRLYSYHELYALLKSVGFVSIEGFGSIKEDPISCHTRDMFLFASKPKGVTGKK